MSYHLSGIVTDDTGSPIANAEVAIRDVNRNDLYVKTATDVRGYYTTDFAPGTASIDDFLTFAGGGEYEYDVQSLAGARPDVVKNLRLHRIRTVPVGQSLVVSIDADSSLAFDGEDWLQLDWRWEKFHVRVAHAGTLTIDARPEVSGAYPSLSVLCRYLTDNCLYSWARAQEGDGRASIIVKANSLFEISLAIPSRMAPQRYALATSLQ
jgi:hypothetical protein